MAALPEDISPEIVAFLAEKLGCPMDKLKRISRFAMTGMRLRSRDFFFEIVNDRGTMQAYISPIWDKRSHTSIDMLVVLAREDGVDIAGRKDESLGEFCRVLWQTYPVACRLLSQQEYANTQLRIARLQNHYMEEFTKTAAEARARIEAERQARLSEFNEKHPLPSSDDPWLTRMKKRVDRWRSKGELKKRRRE